MYEIWFEKTLFPVAPAQIQTKVQGNNKTLNLINEAEVNHIKGTKLTEFSFDLSLPGVEYPFAVYKDGFQDPDYYLAILEQLKISKKPFKFKVLRKDFGGNATWDTSKQVTLESYNIKEDAEELLGVTVSIELKSYTKYGTKKVKVTKKKTYRKSNVDTTKKKIVKSYTTKKGDTLRIIGKKVYGLNTVNNASVIYKKNKAKINNALKSKFNGKFTKRIYTADLPAGVKLTIPQYIGYDYLVDVTGKE